MSYNNSDNNSFLYESTIVSYVIFSLLLFFLCLIIFICKLGDFSNYKPRLIGKEMDANVNENVNANSNILNKYPPSYNSINEN